MCLCVCACLCACLCLGVGVGVVAARLCSGEICVAWGTVGLAISISGFDPWPSFKFGEAPAEYSAAPAAGYALSVALSVSDCLFDCWLVAISALSLSLL